MGIGKHIVFVFPHGSQLAEWRKDKKMGAFVAVIFILVILGLIRRRNLRRAAIRASVRVRVPR